MRRFIDYYLPLFGALLLLGSCKHPDYTVTPPNENIRSAADFLKNNYDFSLFYAALEDTGLLDSLQKDGPYTVLAPTNTAFNEVGIQRAADFEGLDMDSLRFAMAYHILPRRLPVEDIAIDEMDVRYQTLAGKELYACRFVDGDFISFSGAHVRNSDVTLTNGLLHSLDKLMKPYPEATVQEWLASQPDYSIFVAGLQHFGLWEELAQDGPFTVFAPGNDYFVDAGIDADSIARLDTEQYIGSRLFGAYIMYGKHYFITDRYFYYEQGESNFSLQVRDNPNHLYFSTDVYRGELRGFGLSLYEGEEPRPPERLGSVSVNTLSQADHLCANGLVHHINGLLVMPEDAAIESEDEE